MTDLFLKLVNMSISASWIILAVIAARFLLKKAPKWMICALWALVAVRLLCPFSLESALSLMPRDETVREALLSYVPSSITTHVDENIQIGVAGKSYYQSPVSSPESAEQLVGTDDMDEVRKETVSSSDGINWHNVCAIVWITGIVVMLEYALATYRRVRKKVDASIGISDGVYICDYIDSPFILGIVKPKIYLPSAMHPADAQHVLAHERAHLKRKDHWWKPLGFLLLTVYWFNPLMWAAYLLLCRDIELACDERVVKDMGVQEKKDYSEALLKCSVPRHMIAACPLAFGEVGVKERVKNVLNYKKPGFWILLVSVIVLVVVAVCFLTDPESPTVANIMDIPSDEIEQILLWSRTSRADFETEEEIEEFLDFLDTLEYDPVPAASEPIEGDLDENSWSYYTIDIYYEDRKEYILFNYDYTLVWTRDADGNNSLPYHMKDSQRLLDYLNDYVTPVNNRETYAEPFAQQDQPAQWLQGIRLEALRSACFCNEYNNYLSNAQTEELIDILNSIPETAIGPQRYDEDFTFDYRIQSIPFFFLRDDANNLTGILTYYNDSIELSLVESSDYDMHPWEKQQYSALIYTVDSDALRSLFTELTNDPPDLFASSASGYLFNEKLEVVSDGDTTISIQTLENWDYEIILPEDGEDYFGFRCKPKKEEEGWITFGWWGDGFVPADSEQDTQSNLYGYHYSYATGSMASADGDETISMDYDRAYCSHGSFVTSYENTASWSKWYQDTATWLPFWVTVKCELPHSLTGIPDEVASDLANVAYYDWDSVAREIGTEHMTLFSPQYYEDYLFVGCQYEGGYRIACFRKIAAYDYEFVELLTPVSKSLPNDNTQTVPVAEWETEDSPWYLYVIDEETVTGVECNNGFHSYIPVDSHPALVVLDEAMWGTEEDTSVEFDLCYEDLPSLDFSAQSNGSSFEFLSSPQYYLYDCLVQYNDGRNAPGTYSLETQELGELTDILLSLPELTENLHLPNADELFDVTAAAPGSPKVYMQLRLDETYLYMWSDNGVVREDWSDIRLELYYCDGSVTLGVNMTDLGNDFYADHCYFQVESPELEAFLLSKCDDSRKQASLSSE